MQRYFAKNKVENKIYLYDTDIHHIKNVMRMKPNDNIECVYNKSAPVASGEGSCKGALCLIPIFGWVGSEGDWLRTKV